MAKLLINITQDVHDPSTIAGSFNIIANVGLGSVGTLCLLHFFPLKVCQHPSTFYLSGFSILFGITLPVLFSTLKRNPIGIFYILLIISLFHKNEFSDSPSMDLTDNFCQQWIKTIVASVGRLHTLSLAYCRPTGFESYHHHHKEVFSFPGCRSFYIWCHGEQILVISGIYSWAVSDDLIGAHEVCQDSTSGQYYFCCF